MSSGGTAHTGTVEFKSQMHGIQARGDIQPDGTFTLSTYEPNDGAVAGKHDVVVVQLVVVEKAANFRPSLLGVIHPKYGAYSTSGLSFDIEKDKTNLITIVVDPLKSRAPNTPDAVGEHDHVHTHAK
jgi:hypothetical protein